MEELEPARTLTLAGKGPMGVALRMRYELTPQEGGGTQVRIDSAFTGAAVTLMAGKLKDAGTTALQESLKKLGGLVE